MRTLDEIVKAVRMGEEVGEEEARHAIVAFDVLMYALDLPNNPVQLTEYFTAATQEPWKYHGWVNDPRNQDALDWYRAFHNVGEDVKKGGSFIELRYRETDPELHDGHERSGGTLRVNQHQITDEDEDKY